MKDNLSLIAFALLIIVAAPAAIKAQSSKPVAQHESPNAAGEPQGQPSAPVVSRPVGEASKEPDLSNAKAKAAQDNQDPSDHIRLIEWLQLLVNAILAVIVLWQARIYHQQRTIMQQQIDAIETTERAYVGIAKMEMSISGDEPRLDIIWINGGKTPAWHFRCVPSLNIGEKPEPKGFLMDDDFSDIKNSFIPAGAERPVAYTDLGVSLSNEVLAELRGSTSKRLYAVMSGTYRDVRWKPCAFEYWALYIPHPFSPYFVEIESDYEKKQTARN